MLDQFIYIKLNSPLISVKKKRKNFTRAFCLVPVSISSRLLSGRSQRLLRALRGVDLKELFLTTTIRHHTHAAIHIDNIFETVLCEKIAGARTAMAV